MGIEKHRRDPTVIDHHHPHHPQREREKMRTTSILAVVVLAVAMLISAMVVQASAQGRDSSEMASMADAIKYLQGLDKVYGQAARPRFGKRSYPRYLNFNADD